MSGSKLTALTTTISADPPLLSSFNPGLSQDTSSEEGWPGLAQKFTEMTELESFRRFRELNIKTLLYYQVEIAELEAQLKKVEWIDARKSFGREKTYAAFANRMIQSVDRAGLDAESRQFRIVLKIRELLSEYNKALLRYKKVSKLPEGNRNKTEVLRVWIKRGGLGIGAIGGKAARTWGDINDSEPTPPSLLYRALSVLARLFWPVNPKAGDLDLVTVQADEELSTVTRWVFWEFIPLYQSLRHRNVAIDVESQSFYNYNRLAKFTPSWLFRIAVIQFPVVAEAGIACALPIAAIVVLVATEETERKIGYIGLFTALFALCLYWLTSGRIPRTQLLTATITFTAILVVFMTSS